MVIHIPIFSSGGLSREIRPSTDVWKVRKEANCVRFKLKQKLVFIQIAFKIQILSLNVQTTKVLIDMSRKENPPVSQAFTSSSELRNRISFYFCRRKKKSLLE